MRFGQRQDRLILDDKPLINEHVGCKFPNDLTTVFHCDVLFLFNLVTCFSQLICQSILIDRFKKSRAKR